MRIEHRFLKNNFVGNFYLNFKGFLYNLPEIMKFKKNLSPFTANLNSISKVSVYKDLMELLKCKENIKLALKNSF